MKIQFMHSKKTAEDIYSFYFQNPDKLRYVAGQFIELTIEHENPDSRGTKRWFTLSSSPTEELLCITTKISDKHSSYKKALQNLKQGSSVRISESMGDFILPKDASIPIVFIAGGIGITPYRSMIKWLHDTKSRRSIELLYFAVDESHIAFREDISQPFVARTFVTDGTKLSFDLLSSYITDVRDKHIYISGPEKMTESFVAELLSSGFTKQTIITDYFPGYTEL